MKGIRFLHAFICVLICAVIFSGTALADEPAYEARIGSTYYQTLEEAFSAAKYPDMFIITLLCDVTDITSTITVSGGCTLDMNGFDIKGSCTIFHVTTGDLTLVDLTDSGSSLISTSGDCAVLSDLLYHQWNVNVISETGAAIKTNADSTYNIHYCGIYSGTATGKTYGVYCKESFCFLGGTLTGGTAYYFSEAARSPGAYIKPPTVSEDGRSATVSGYENFTAVYTRNLCNNTSSIVCFDTLIGAVKYCEGILYDYEVKLTLLHDVNLDQERPDDPNVIISQRHEGPWTLDMSGHTITGSGTVIDNYSLSNLTVTNSSNKPSMIICGSDKVPAIKNQGGLTLENVAVSGGSCGIRQSEDLIYKVPSVLTLNNASIACENGSGIEYSSGTIKFITGTVSGAPYAAHGTDGSLWTGYTLGENSGYKINTDTTVTAALKHPLTVTAGNGGSIPAEISGNYLEGAEISISAIPDVGYYFSGWISSGGGTFENANSTLTTFTMPASAAAVTAIFAQINSGDSDVIYTISASAGAGGSISPSGSASVADGHDKNYTITTNDGYEIKDVLVDGVSVGAVDSYMFENVKKTTI